MFGFGKKKAPEPPQRPRRDSQESRDRKAQNVAQLGFLVGVDDNVDLDVDDADLEDELLMLLNGEDVPIRGKPKQPSAPPRQRAQPPIPSNRPKTTMPSSNINIDNFSVEDEGDDSDVDLDDPDLAAELNEITGEGGGMSMTAAQDNEEDSAPPPVPTKTREEILQILGERVELYEKAKAIADANGDSGKSRRFVRSIKTLNDQILKAKAGKVVDESEIPPPVSLGSVIPKPIVDPTPANPDSSVNTDGSRLAPTIKTPPRPFTPEPDYNTVMNLPEPLVPISAYVPPKVTLPVEPVVDPVVQIPVPLKVDLSITTNTDPQVEIRLKDYKRVAVALKRAGDTQGAVQYLKLSKALESAIKTGESVDLSNYPPIPSATPVEVFNEPATPTPDPPMETISEPPPQQPTSEDPAPPSEDIFGAPPAPNTIMEGLEQRLEKYKSEVEKATSASNASKARRVGRIVKQYEEAISFYKKGKPIAYEELPTPPGFAPIPYGAPAVAPANTIHHPEPHVPANVPAEKPAEKKLPPASPQGPSSSSPSGISGSSTGSSIQRGGKPVTKLTLQEKQLSAIILRQKQFKEAAVNAKKRGDIDQAREFLRTAKGFDKLISHSQAGLPVDMATLPAPPEAVAALESDSDFEMITQADCIQVTGTAAEVFAKLEEDLKAQMKMCMRTRDHFKSIGDIGSANRFESMALESKRDLDTMRLAARKGDELPKHHYETRIFSIPECNTDITEDEIEISVLQGVNYKVSNPSDVDTYVRVELSYPSAEEAQSNKTQLVKDTNNPNYNATFKMNINRTARNFQRFVHRHGVKFEVYSKGGFLRSNTLIGQATAKLLPLETKCTLHDGFDILDGRKVVGKLEAKIRIRDPVLTKQINQKKEKWLSIDRA